MISITGRIWFFNKDGCLVGTKVDEGRFQHELLALLLMSWQSIFCHQAHQDSRSPHTFPSREDLRRSPAPPVIISLKTMPTQPPRLSGFIPFEPIEQLGGK